MMKIKKLGFFLISHKAHVHHTVPVACEVSMDSRFSVTIFVSTQKIKEIVKSIFLLYPGHKCTILFLKTSKFYTITRAIKGRLYPGLNSILKFNLEELFTYDALITPHPYLSIVLDRDKEKKLKYILLTHGSGDSPISYDVEKSRYDLLLLGGREVCETAIANGLGNADKIKLVGYAKFDIVKRRDKENKVLFKNDKPVIVYAPSYLKNYSSWYKWGEQILDYFSRQDKYNLIFAPHVKVFQSKSSEKLEKKYADFNNILIDTGSDSLIDMTYTQNSDLFMGDVSSQGYEFLYHPRPCVFLNPYHLDWKKEKILMWQLGEIVDDISQLDSKLDMAFANHAQYAEKQKEAFVNRFSLTDIPSGKRAAEEIIKFLIP